MSMENKLLLQSVGLTKPAYADKDWEDVTNQLKNDFEEYFKTTPYFNGENCSPKYETYRVCWKAYIAGFKNMVGIVYEDCYIDDYGNSCLDENSSTCKIIYTDNLF